MPIPWSILLYSGSAASAGGMAWYEFAHNDNYYDRMKWAELAAGVSQTQRFYLSSGLKDYLYRNSEVYRIENPLAREAWNTARPYVQQIDATAAAINQQIDRGYAKADELVQAGQQGLEQGLAKADEFLREGRQGLDQGLAKADEFLREGRARLDQGFAKADQLLQEGRGRLDQAGAFVQEFAQEGRAELRQGLAGVGDQLKNLSDEVQKFATNVERRVDQASEGWLAQKVLGTKPDLSAEEYRSLAAMNREAGGAENWYHKYDDGPNNPIEKAYSRLTDEGRVPEPKIPGPATPEELQQRHPWIAEKNQAMADRPAGFDQYKSVDIIDGHAVRTEIRLDEEREITRFQDGEAVFRSRETFDNGGRCIERTTTELQDRNVVFRSKETFNDAGRCIARQTEEIDGPLVSKTTYRETAFNADENGAFTRNYVVEKEERFLDDDGRLLVRTIKDDIREVGGNGGTVAERSLFRHVETKEPGILWDGKQPPQDFRLKETFNADGTINTRFLQDKDGVIGEQVRYDAQGAYAGSTRELRSVAGDGPVQIVSRDLNGVNSYKLNGNEQLKNPVLFKEPPDKHAYADMLEGRAKGGMAAGQPIAAAHEGPVVAGRGGVVADGEAIANADAQADRVAANIADPVPGQGRIVADGEAIANADAQAERVAANIADPVPGQGRIVAEGEAEALAKAGAADGVVAANVGEGVAGQGGAAAADRARIADALERAGIERAEAERLAAQAVDGAKAGTIESRLDALFNERGPLKEVDPHRFRDEANKPDQALYLLQFGENVVLAALLFMGDGEPDTGTGLGKGKEAFGAARESLIAANPNPANWIGPAMDSYATANKSLIDVAEKSAVDGSWLVGKSSLLTKLQGEVSDQASTVSWDRFFVGNWLIGMMILEPICRKLALVSQGASNSLQLTVVTTALLAVAKTVSQLKATAQTHATNVDRYVSELRALQRQVQQIAVD